MPPGQLYNSSGQQWPAAQQPGSPLPRLAAPTGGVLLRHLDRHDLLVKLARGLCTGGSSWWSSNTIDGFLG